MIFHHMIIFLDRALLFGLDVLLCNVNTHYRILTYGNKYCFMGHQCFLILNQKYRNEYKSSDETKEISVAPSTTSGSHAMNQMKDIKFTLGKYKGICGVNNHTWKKRRIFFDISSREYSLVRHNLYVMHIEINVCENIMYTPLEIYKKSKDNLNARFDLKDMKIRTLLWP